MKKVVSDKILEAMIAQDDGKFKKSFLPEVYETV